MQNSILEGCLWSRWNKIVVCLACW